MDDADAPPVGAQWKGLPIRYLSETGVQRVGAQSLDTLRARLPDDVLVPLIRLMLAGDRLRALGALVHGTDGVQNEPPTRTPVTEAREVDTARWLCGVVLTEVSDTLSQRREGFDPGYDALAGRLDGSATEALHELRTIASEWQDRQGHRRLRNKGGAHADPAFIRAGLNTMQAHGLRAPLIEQMNSDPADMRFPLAWNALDAAAWLSSSEGPQITDATALETRNSVERIAHAAAHCQLLIAQVVRGVLERTGPARETPQESDG